MAEQIAQIRFDSNPAFQNRKPRIANRTGWSRREFLKATALTGSSALLGLTSNTHAADPAPETTKIALAQSPALCTAPQIVAEELLRGEGFTDIQYLRTGSAELYKTVASGQAQLGMGVTLRFILDVDAGAPTVLLTGVHVGCYELFGVGTVRSVNNLKNKTVSVPGLHSGAHALLASMAAYVGLNPAKDIKWVVHPFAESMRLLADGKIDAFMGFPPEPQELRAKKIGHVIVNSMMDRPWSQYFCCMVIGNREFVRKNPVATKRTLRAIMKATDLCAREPQRAARYLVDRGYTKNYDFALQTMKDMHYAQWRDFDPEDTIRFYSLRLHEVGMIKTSPNKLIAQAGDWRFLRELKKELKT